MVNCRSCASTEFASPLAAGLWLQASACRLACLVLLQGGLCKIVSFLLLGLQTVLCVDEKPLEEEAAIRMTAINQCAFFPLNCTIPK